MNDARQAPRKLFREEARTGSVKCPACGAAITLHGFGAIERVVCSHCGSELRPEHSGELALIQRVQRERRRSVLDLHLRGQLGGTTWEILGVLWRQCRVGGEVYPWQEFLLFNPYRGYRWLVFSITDGHWSLGRALDGAPRSSTSFGHASVEFRGETFRHFQTVVAETHYVEGEFPWQVHVGDKATAHEYVAPPKSISIEQSSGPDGEDVNFTELRYISPAEVWKAFDRPDAPPPTRGIGSIEPNPWKQGRKLTTISFALLLLAWAAVTTLYIGSRDSQEIFAARDLSPEPFVQEIEVPGSSATTLQFELSGRPLSNSYLYTDVILIEQASEEAIAFGVTVEDWHGVEGGESWREGNSIETVTIGGVTGGSYTLQVVPETGGESPGLIRMDIALRRDVPLWRYPVAALIVIVVFPAMLWFLGWQFEGRRWRNSDHSPEE